MAIDTIDVNKEIISKLVSDVAMIKDYLLYSKEDDEGELTDWAKQELADARKIPDSENISIEELEREIFAK